MGLFTSTFSKSSDQRTPIKGPLPKILNVFKVHHRAILGCLFPLVLIPWQPEKGRTDITARCLWIWMFFSFLFQPVNIPVTALIPIFLLPMTGTVDTGTVCKCYYNDNIALFVLGNMLLLMINSCGFDKRLIMKLLCSGDNCQFAGKRIIFKACTAAYFLSMFSNRLIVSSTIINYLTPIYLNLQANNKGSEPNYDEMRYIINNAVQVASAIGSTAFINSAVTPLAMRAIYATHPGKNFEYPDIFNFLQYSLFAFPTTFIMFILTFSFHMLLLNCVVGKPMSAGNMTEVRNKLRQKQSELPTQSCHEVLCLFFYVLFLIMAFTRWCPIVFNNGWADFYTLTDKVPGIKDATVAAIFVIVLSALPRTCNTLRFILAEKRSELGSVKPESSILWWRYTDKKINYAYGILIGSGIALNTAVRMTGLNKAVSESYMTFLTTPNWIITLLLICFIAVFLSCTMSGVATCVIFMPAVLNMITDPGPAARVTTEELQKKLYLAALAVGMGTSYGFTTPFMFTPAYFCNKEGKVPTKKMIVYSIVPAIICMLVLWIAIYAYGPVIFDPSGSGIPAYATGSAPAPKPSAEPAPEPSPAPTSEPVTEPAPGTIPEPEA